MNRRRFLSTACLAGLARAMPVPIAAVAAGRQAKPLNLKITEVKTFVVNVGSVNWVFCVGDHAKVKIFEPAPRQPRSLWAFLGWVSY